MTQQNDVIWCSFVCLDTYGLGLPLFTVIRHFCLARNLYVCISITLLLPQLMLLSTPPTSLPLRFCCHCCCRERAKCCILIFQHLMLCSLCHINWCVFNEKSELGFVYFALLFSFFASSPLTQFFFRSEFGSCKKYKLMKKSCFSIPFTMYSSHHSLTDLNF